MENQKHLFQLEDDVHYFNAAYMSPLLKSVEEKGIEGIRRKRNPQYLKAEDFFSEANELRTLFGQLVNCQASEVAIIPSASYGLGSAIQNVIPKAGQYAIMVEEEFPSAFFPLKRWMEKYESALKIIETPQAGGPQGAYLNQLILDAIQEESAMLVISSIHWMNGLRFDLEKIGAKCKETGTLLIVDATQSIGSLPLDVKTLNIDALICAGYKCLLGAYSMGLAYYGEAFHEGIPLEESWMNRSNAVDFRNLTDYDPQYTAAAGRYNVGEFSNFVLVPMLAESIRQILEWKPERIQAYCLELTRPLLDYCREKGWPLEDEAYRVGHLLGLQLPLEMDLEALLQKLQERKVFLSLRGNSLRVATHLYNTPRDIDVLIDTLESCL
ncbi:MAG: aminotransferase class V-fold PLP-dependent enzyme [Bacteroidota bacterium]